MNYLNLLYGVFVKKMAKVALQINIITFIATYWILKFFIHTKSLNILFASDSNDRLVGNLECVHEDLLSRKIQNIKIHYSLKRKIDLIRSPLATFNLARFALCSAVIVLDDYFPEFNSLKLRENTFLLQLWHASGAYKRVGHARKGLPGGPSTNSYAHRGYSAAIVSSQNIRQCYAEAFNMPIEKIYATGVPRTDKFFNPDWVSDTRRKIRLQLGVRESQILVLVATTFYGNGQITAYSKSNEYDWEYIRGKIPNLMVAIKDHPFTSASQKNQRDDIKFGPDCNSSQIDELLVGADMLITDFSSIIFDAAILRKPTIHLTKDQNYYSINRGFFYEPSSYIWGKTAKTEDEIIDGIISPFVDESSLSSLTNKHISSSDGSSTKRVVDQLVIPNL